jgi:hypothetical protein
MTQPLLIQTRDKWHEVLRDALAKTAEFERLDSSWSLLKNVRRQLEYMQSCVAGGRSPTADEASKVDVGPLAVRNFDDTQPEYAKWLMELDYAFRHWDRLG